MDSPQTPDMLPSNPETGAQSERDRILKVFPSKTVKTLSITQLVCAILAPILQLIVFGKRENCVSVNVTSNRISVVCFDDEISFFGTGLWTGIFFGISGGVGLLAYQRPSRCNIITLLVLNIISSLFCGPLIGFALLGFLATSPAKTTITDVCYGIQILIALVQAVTAIVTAGYSGRAVCVCKKQSHGTTGFPENFIEMVPNTNLGYMDSQTVQPQHFMGMVPNSNTGYMDSQTIQSHAFMGMVPNSNAGYMDSQTIQPQNFMGMVPNSNAVPYMDSQNIQPHAFMGQGMVPNSNAVYMDSQTIQPQTFMGMVPNSNVGHMDSQTIQPQTFMGMVPNSNAGHMDSQTIQPQTFMGMVPNSNAGYMDSQTIQPQTFMGMVPNSNAVYMDSYPLNQTTYNPASATNASALRFQDNPPVYSSKENEPQHRENYGK